MKQTIVLVVSIVCPMFILYRLISRKMKNFEKHMHGRFGIEGMTIDLILKELGIIGKDKNDPNYVR